MSNTYKITLTTIVNNINSLEGGIRVLATHKVKDSNNTTVGFIIGEGFYSEHSVRVSVDSIDNITITKSGKLRCKKELPIITYKNVLKSNYSELVKRNPFSRDIQKELLDWKKRGERGEEKGVLQLEGARQIGKTTELLKFGYSNYDYVIYISLTDDVYKFESIITKGGINPVIIDRYCKNANLPNYIDSNKTLLIIDEIQLSSEIYNRIRSFNSNLKCDLIVTGSYLGKTLRSEYFHSAGTVEYCHMSPLSFKEFCRVFKSDTLLETIDLYGKSDTTEYQKLDTLYNIYRQIGGYPAVVKQFVASKDINSCGRYLQNILEAFKKESSIYFDGDRETGETGETGIFDNIYVEAIKEMCIEKRGTGGKYLDIVVKVANEASQQKAMISRKEVLRAINWLYYSRIMGACGLYLDGDVLNRVASRRNYFMDCGIANYIAGMAKIEGSNKEGLLTETFVYAELYRLCKKDYSDKIIDEAEPNFSIYGDYELDFMIQGKDGIKYGIEVKTSRGEPKSLKVYIEKKLIDRGILAKRTQGGKGDKFDTIHIYTIGERFPYKR